jgi:5-methylcytosine-specific restriction endonuclease McrA
MNKKFKMILSQEQFVKKLTGKNWERLWKVRMYSHNSRAKRLGISGRLTYEGIIRALEKSGFACVYCGSEEFISIDHVTPLSRGGSNTDENLQAVCAFCNMSKHEGDSPRNKTKSFCTRPPSLDSEAAKESPGRQHQVKTCCNTE